MRNSIVYLAKNIKLDRKYVSVLNYTESELLSLITSQENLVYQANTFSFLREEENVIKIEIPYGTALQCNYLAFQNPDYSNKWFFAFVDEVNYVSDKVTKIKYTVDLFSTWWSYWSPKACFTVREHVVDDTIGLNTVPEDVTTGDYIVNAINKNTALNSTKIIIGTTVDYYIDSQTGNFVLGGNNGGGVYGGVYTAYRYYYFERKLNSKLTTVIQGFADNGRSDALGMIFTAPFVLLDEQDPTILDDGNIKEDMNAVTMRWSDYGDSPITKLTTLNGYSPANNKLKTYPYMYLYMTNNNGGNAIYKFELFTGLPHNNCNFEIKGIICPGMSGILYPIDYNGSTGANYSESIPLPKYPICGWPTDLYTNWLTQQGVNRSIDIFTSTIGGAGGGAILGGSIGGVPGALVGAGVGAIASFGNTIFNQLVENKNHEFIPPQATGNINTGDISFTSGNTTFTAYSMSIKYEFAKTIDDYFTRLGYKVNKVKIPNMGNRQNYNYVEIGASETLCFPNNYNNIMIPAKDLENLNNIFRSGVTIWNNHNNLGDYSVSNNIVN